MAEKTSIASTAYPVQSIAGQVVTVSGNAVTECPNGSQLHLYGTTGSDGIFTVNGTPEFSTPNTAITVTGTIVAQAGVAGNAYRAWDFRTDGSWVGGTKPAANVDTAVIPADSHVCVVSQSIPNFISITDLSGHLIINGSAMCTNGLVDINDGGRLFVGNGVDSPSVGGLVNVNSGGEAIFWLDGSTDATIVVYSGGILRFTGEAGDYTHPCTNVGGIIVKQGGQCLLSNTAINQGGIVVQNGGRLIFSADASCANGFILIETGGYCAFNDSAIPGSSIVALSGSALVLASGSLSIIAYTGVTVTGEGSVSFTIAETDMAQHFSGYQDVSADVTTALNTAIPGSPTSGSVFDRIVRQTPRNRWTQAEDGTITFV